ncbi:MAG TPA: hypothetical protein VGJ94_07260 [Syntrophorhabdaceae bacterium]
MKTLTTAFSQEKNKKTGISPVWILKCPFASGTIYLSDIAFTIAAWNGGITTKPWVKEWGKVDEDISGSLSLTKVSDFSVQVIIDPDASPHISGILANPSNNVESTDIELYLWFLGLDPATAPPNLMWSGNIMDYRFPDELTCRLDLVDHGVKLDRYIGTLLDTETYPRLDPADIGKMANIVMGDVENVPCHCICAGGATCLTADITATSPGPGGQIPVKDGSRFPSGNYRVKVGDEIILCNNSHDAYLTVAASGRGYDATVAAAHSADDPVVEHLAAYAYLVADNDTSIANNGVVSVTEVRVDGETVTDGVSVLLEGGIYAAQKAVVTLVHGPVDVSNYEVLSPFNVASASWSNGNSAIDGDESTAATTVSQYAGYLRVNFAPSVKRAAVVKQEVEAVLNVPVGAILTVADWAPSTITNTGGTVVRSFTKTGGARSDPIVFSSNSAVYTTSVFEVRPKKVFTYKVSPGASTAARSNVGDLVTVHAITASPATAHTPGKIVERLLYAYAGWPAEKFVSGAAGGGGNISHPSYVSGYTLSVLINEYRRLREWLSLIAFQSRSYFRFAAGKAYLIYRPDSLGSQRNITDAMIRMGGDFRTTLQMERSPLDEVINKINLKYNRDWSKFGDEAYGGIAKASDPSSMARYGEKERADLFSFGFVKSISMAESLRDFYLARYKDRKKIFTLEVFLDNMDLQFADGITLNPAGEVVCEIWKVNISPGSGMDMKNDTIQLLAKEY